MRFLRRGAKLLGILLCLFLVYNVLDERLAPGFDNLFQVDNINERDNGFIAAAGIAAPKEQDIFAYGKQSLKWTENERSQPHQDEITYSDNVALDCWVMQVASSSQSCADEQMLTQTIQANQLLLTRYLSLYEYSRFVDQISGWHNGQLLINLHRLYLAQLSLLARQNPTDALTRWMADTRYWQRVIADRQGFVGKAVVLVIYGANLQFLPVLIQAHPDLALQYKTELYTITDVPVFGEGGWDIAATMRAEYAMLGLLEKQEPTLSSIFFYKPNATRNKLYYYTQDLITLSQKPAAEFVSFKKTIANPYDEPVWKKMSYNAIGNLVFEGIWPGINLLSAMHNNRAQLKMLKLYIEAKSQNIPASAMQQFIGASDVARNPLTNQPFLWDEPRYSIYFIVDETNGKRREILY